MNNEQNKKSYIKPELSSLGSAVELTLNHPWRNYNSSNGYGYSHSSSHSSSYSQSGGKPGHYMMS